MNPAAATAMVPQATGAVAGGNPLTTLMEKLQSASPEQIGQMSQVLAMHGAPPDTGMPTAVNPAPQGYAQMLNPIAQQPVAMQQQRQMIPLGTGMNQPIGGL